MPVGLFYFVEKTLIFPCSNGGEILPRRILCGFFIQINGNFQFLADPLSELLCTGDYFPPVDIADRDKRANISRAHAGVRALVFAHIDQFCRFFDSTEGAFHHRLRTANEGHNGSVRRYSRINIKQRYSLGRRYRVGNLPDHGGIATLGKIRHTFNQLLHGL